MKMMVVSMVLWLLLLPLSDLPRPAAAGRAVERLLSHTSKTFPTPFVSLRGDTKYEQATVLTSLIQKL